MTTLEDVLRRSLDSEATRLAPAADPDAAWRELGRRAARPARHRRRAAGFGVGVTAVGAAIAVAVVASGARDPHPRKPSAAVPLGPVVRTIAPAPARGTEGTRWTAVSFADALHGWATGSNCGLGGNENSCHALLAKTSDAGRTWKTVPSPVKYAQVLYGGTPYAVPGGGLYVAEYLSPSVLYTGDGKSWKTIRYTTGRFSDGLATMTVVGRSLVISATRGEVDAVSPGGSCVTGEVLTTITGGAVSSRTVSVPESLGAETIGFDGSRWDTSSMSPCVKGSTYVPPTTPSPPADGIRVAGPTGAFGPRHSLPAQTNSVAPVNRLTAWLAGWDNKLWVTHDGGATWHDAGTVDHMQQVVPTDGTHAVIDIDAYPGPTQLVPWALGRTDTTTPTLTIPTGRGNGIMVLGVSGGAVRLVDQGGRYLVSTDAGRTWHLQGQLPTSLKASKTS